VSAPFHALGIDVGGTKMAAGLVSFPAGELRLRRQMATAPERGGAAVLEDVLRLAAEIAAEARSSGLPLSAIGLGLCELVDAEGKAASASTVAWRGLPARERLSALAPAVFEADVRAAALAEAHFGAGKAHRIFLYVTVGTGISCSLVLDGKPYRGARGAAGTMASSPLSVACERCGGLEGRTLEEIASGPALVARYNRRGGAAAASGEQVLAAAGAGDAAAREVVESAARALGVAVGHLVNTLDPEAVVVGGGLGLSGGLYWESFTAAARRHLWSELHRDLPIHSAALGQDAGIIGAAAAAWRELEGGR
jgi:glucokinase